MDYSLELVLGEPINFYNICKIHQLSISDIIDKIGIEKYYKLLLPYIIDKNNLKINDKNISNFDLLFLKIKSEKNEEIDMFPLFLQSLKIFCKVKDIFVDKENLNIVFDNNEYKNNLLISINKNNFDEFASIILNINGIKKPQHTKPSKSKIKNAIKEKLQKGRERNKNNNDNNLATIINIVKFGMQTYINKEEIKKMTIWEVYNAYYNILNKEKFQHNFDMYLVGGNKDNELDLSHWSINTINKNNKI